MPLMLTGAHLLVIMWVDGLAVKHTLPPASWLQLEQVYFLSVLVVGTTKGEAVTAPVFDAKRADATLLSSTKQCTRMSLEAILEGAQLAACKPGTYMVALGSTERWDLLYGFMHVHWWVGEHDIYRVHAFNCRCRQVQPMLETPLDPMPYLAIQLTHPVGPHTWQVPMCSLPPRKAAKELPLDTFEDVATRALTSKSKWADIPWDTACDSSVCHVCHDGSQVQGKNEIVVCDGCGCLEHMACMTNPVSEVPLHEWLCGKCKDNKHSEQEQLAMWEEQPGQLSDFELARLETIASNNAMLRELGLA